MDSETSTGSLDGVGSNGFPAIDKNLGVPGLKPDLKTVEQLANPPKSKATIQAEQNNALKYERFKQFSALPDEVKKENAQKVEDEINGIGFLNNIASFGKEAYNTAIEGMSSTPMTAGLKQLKVNTEPLADEKKEAKDLMLKQGVNPKDINSNSVLELAKKIKLQKLNDSDVESRKKDFLSDTNINFEDLKKGANVELSKISDKDKELLKQKAILEPALKDSDNRLNQLNQQLANFKKNNQQPTQEFVDEYNYAIKYHNEIVKDVQKTDNQFAENRDKIGDLKTNLDLFKRQYGKVNNFVSNIGATALDLAAGGFGIVDYGFNAAYGALGVDTGPKESSEIVTGLKGASQKIRDRIAKPINIDNIEDAGDFGDWMANTVIANQIPIYGLIATGTGGIVALGGSSLGTKYGDMVQEMNPDHPVEGQILKKYSDAELAWKPVGFGIAETASALVDAHIMKGAARVLASATEPERKLISQTIAKRLLDVGGQTIKGGSYEAVDEMATQGVENLIDGKPFTEGMKDAGGAGGAMGALIPFFAGNIAMATKPFSIDNKIQNLAKKTLVLEKELANQNLSEEARKIIKTNFEESKKTTENLLKKQVKDISKMPNENFQEILKIENKQAKLKEKAVEIKTQDGLSNDIKKQLLSDFSAKFNALEKDRVDILSGEKTMPKIEEKDAKVEIPITETEVETEVQEPTVADEEKVTFAEQPVQEQVQYERNMETGEMTHVEGVVAPSVEGKDKVKEHISTLANDNYLFTHVTTEDNARNITENGMSVSLGTGISSTLTASGQESATNQAERLMNGEVVHRDLNNNSVAIISVPKAELDKMSGKSLAEKFENWLVENNHINDKGELAIPKELNAGYLSGQNFITNESTSPTNTPANGNVQSRVEPMGEIGITEQQSPAKESIPRAVDVKPSESDNEVDYALNQIDKGILQWNGDINSPRIDLGISWADIRKGEADLKRGKVDSAPAKRLIEAIGKSKADGGYRYKLGTGGVNMRSGEFVTFEDLQRANNELPLTDAELEEVNRDQEQLVKEYYDSFDRLTEEEQNEILENYENKIDESTKVGENTEVGNSENDVQNEKTPSRKEKRIKVADAKIDDFANALKDLLPSVDTNGLKKQGLSQDEIIDFIAKSAKELAKTGIEIDEAIRQVIGKLNERFEDLNVDEKLVKEKIEVDVRQDFERKPGKKSVLNRMASGNSSAIKKAIAKYSLDYEIENQKEAKLKAEMFVDEVGVDDALIAVRKGLIDGAQGAFIYARAIEILEQEINDLKGDDKLDAIADYQELLGQISDELDNRSRSNGRFIAALAEIYNSSGGRYDLTKMVNDYKAQNNGVISKEVLGKLKNVEQKLKESEAKLAELEAKKRIEEENEAFNNILESVARRKRINTNAKISDKQKAQAFADKLLSYKISNRANLSVATPFSIAYDLAIDAAAKAIVATGFISDAIKAGVNSIRNSKLSKDEQEQALSDLFDLFDDSDVNTGQRGIMSIDQEGKLRIPHSLIREKVENGIDNIDDLVSALMTDAEKLFPDLDFTERQVRDIITGYGKISNPTSDEIETQISIMKSLGKIASGLEDVNKGQRPLRSGQQRREPTMQERVEMKKLKALLRDLPLAEADIKKAYKTALDAIKKRLSNEIEELDEQIANGEKRKGQKTVIEYDQEAKDLKAIRDAKKVELDELVGKPELTEQQKIDRAEKLLQKRLDDLKQKIDANEIDYAKKPETVTSVKLEEMRKLKKEYEAQIQKMREDSGLAEERLIEIAKRNASKRLSALKERIANKDFDPRKRKPTPTDVELNKIKSEIAAQKEIFDKEVYKLELKNRRIEQKAFDALKDILSVPKILSFTGDLSFVGIQNVTQVYKMAANSLINLAKTGKLKGTFRDAMAKTFKAMANPDFEQKYMQAVKANPSYQLWKDSKLGIVESHYKESAKAEVFQHNAITTLFDILGNYVASKGYEKAGNIIKNYVNIISIFERGQTVFENQMRINRFQEGADLLKAQGLNPVDDIQEYRKVAAAVNTLTGRANTGSKAAAALREANGTIFSSFSNWAAGVNQLNPFWYYTLTPTARKMALTDVAHHIVGAGSLLAMASLYALGQDDDDEDKVTVEADPRSSDFAVIKVGNLRIDPWAGKKTTVVAFARLSGEKKDKYGNFKKYGIEYEDEDWIDLPLEYVGNKIAPGPRFAIDRFFKTKEVEYQGNKFREDKYGVDFKESKYLIPLIFENFKEVNEEQPNLFGKAAMALSWTGLINTNVYGGAKEGFKDMPDDLVEKEYKAKIQKLKDNEKILDSNIEKFTKDYVEKKINKFQILQKVESLVDGDAELYEKTVKSIIEKVNKEELKTLVTDPFYLGLKKEKNPEIQAILFYSKFKDDSGMSEKDKRERDKNLAFIEFDSSNPRFREAYQQLKSSKKKPIN